MSMKKADRHQSCLRHRFFASKKEPKRTHGRSREELQQESSKQAADRSRDEAPQEQQRNENAKERSVSLSTGEPDLLLMSAGPKLAGVTDSPLGSSRPTWLECCPDFMPIVTCNGTANAIILEWTKLTTSCNFVLLITYWTNKKVQLFWYRCEVNTFGQ